MIARIWHGWAPPDNADGYEKFLHREMFPRMGELAGYCGVYLLRRESGDEVEFITVTLWESLDAIRTFAGEDYEQAVVEPEARALLSHFDDRSAHYDVREKP